MVEAVGTGNAGAANATGYQTAGFNRGGLMSLFDLVFGCWHKRCSFPITVRGKLRRSTAAAFETAEL